MRQIRKVAVILRPAGIGDVLNATPGLRELRRRYPRPHEIHVFLDREGARQILEGNPDIDSAVVGLPPRASPKQLRKGLVEVLDISQYPAKHECLLVPNITTSRIDLYSEGLGNEQLNDHAMILNLSAEELNWGGIFAGQYEGCLKIAIQPRSSEIYKDWPIKYFRKLTSMIHRSFPDIVLFSTDKEAKLPWTIPVITDVKRLAAVVKHCDGAIMADTLLLHVAAGLYQLPTLAIFGPSGYRAGYESVILAQRTDLDCCPCWKNSEMRCNPEPEMQRLKEGGRDTAFCMEELSPESVFVKFKYLLKGTEYGKH